MMYARSASLDFQAHLQYEKIRNSSMPNSAAAAMVACGQQDVSRNQEYHQHTKQHHELQPPSRNFDSASSAPPLRNQDTTHSMDSDDSVDDDERLLQQAIGDTNSCTLVGDSSMHSLSVCRIVKTCF
jgi:hypothetical protein